MNDSQKVYCALLAMGAGAALVAEDLYGPKQYTAKAALVRSACVAVLGIGVAGFVGGAILLSKLA